jgi:glutamate-1-semialdehyde 2,1-aminomutase
MSEEILADLRLRIEDEYRRRTPKSAAMHQQAQNYLPNGESRTGTSFLPYPTYFERGEGCYLYDVDGNTVLDFTNNATSLIHGHAHPAIVEALQRQAARGTAWAAPNPQQVRLARILRERVPSLERIRFCNSGTEANMHAIKVARAFTGRDKILKMHSAYHGTYEGVEFDDRAESERAAPTTHGIPANAADNVFVSAFNDEAAVERLVVRRKHDLAAVIVNPVVTSSGLELPSEGYLSFLRDITRECGVLLIFDEVITFRVAAGGAQAYYGVAPDLTALGKIIGGGLPVGAIGGRADIMQLFVQGNPPVVSHAGTFNANPLTMAAGVAAMELLTPAAFAHLDWLGNLLYERLAAAAGDLLPAFELKRIASLVSLAPAQALQAHPAMSEVMRLMQLALLNRGIKTYRFFAVSTVMTEAEIEQIAASLQSVLLEFRPAITTKL